MELWLLLFVFIKFAHGQYDVPQATVEVYSPRGLKVSIPDEEGIKLFAFHGKINEEMNGREGGIFSRDIVKPKDGRWTFYEPTAKLNIGDKLYYWTYVDYFDGKNKLGYTNDDQFYEVKEFQKKPGECKPSQTMAQGKTKICSGDLIFSEHFLNLDPSRWNTEIKFGGPPDYEFVIYGNYSQTLSIKNEKLHIRPIPTEDVYGKGFVFTNLDLNTQAAKCTGSVYTCYRKAKGQFIVPPVLSSQINTKNKFAFKYGKIEVRAKLPKGNWIYPEIFLNPLTEKYGSDFLSGQMRIAFSQGNPNLIKKVSGGVILGDGTIARTYGMKSRKNPNVSEFHNYTLLWAPDKIVLSFDGEIYGEIYPPPGGFKTVDGLLSEQKKALWNEGSNLAPFDQEMYITLGVGVGGHNFNDKGDKPWKNFDPLAEMNFYQDTENWKKTWNSRCGLEIEHVLVYAL
ncbi:beta-1,3-glucan-binding protein-like isoform X1 [Aethina tumida]|uniref:beta-1,3-glucan-binding protein-like isoform X1 n=1 Tax=Aethina tumida TaxID=116153 RepID=UPI00096B0948|nr:beta-1,3-glucan-binding protein-like isoform X1 [Aethina tumida]